ncbi:hypothetical protein M8J77_013749 [Diaphorina citri]|nr:hypothetical protein M8J77_013749 [Diaphorina citri]
MEHNHSLASDDILPCDLTGTQRIPVGSHMIGCVKSANMRHQKVNKSNSAGNNNNYKIATWNVQGLNGLGKIENVMNEMKNMQIDVLGISETFLQGTGDFFTNLPSGEKYRTIYSGGDVSRKGTAFIINQKFHNRINNIILKSERIIAMKIQAKPVDIFIIQCYAPNLESDEEEKEAFYDDLRKTIEKKKFQEILILMGDFNAKIGNQKVNDIVGPYGLGTQNEAGELLINFCHENSLFVSNRKISSSLIDSNGNELFEPESILKRWAEYCENLYKDERPDLTATPIEDNDIPEFTINQIKHVIKRLNNKKSPGPDDIPAEFLKLMDGVGLGIITDMINSIYARGMIPKDFLQSIFIPLPKVSKAKNCADFRTISLISHTSKILLYLIKDRIYNIIEANLTETQMGFRGGKGCRDAISAMRILLEKSVEKDEDIFMTFIDYEKAFDNVNHVKLVSILRSISIPQADIRLIEQLYWGQRGKVRTSAGLSEEFTIVKGVRQGCIISPILFNIYVEQIIKESITEEPYGILINNRIVNNLRYADDLVLLSSNLDGLKELLKKLSNASTKYNMKINVKKSKFMKVSKQGRRRLANINVNGQIFEEVPTYKYLGSEITNDSRCDTEIKKRIALAKNAFWKHKEIMRRNISKRTKLRLLKTYVFSILTYGSEAWTVNKIFGKKINAFEQWCYRRMLKVSWIEKVTNKEILRRMGKEKPELLNIIRERKLKFAGHMIRGSSGQLLLDIIEGNIDGRRPRGRPRRVWLDDVKEWLGLSTYEECKDLAMNRELFRSTTIARLATIDNDDATQ